MPEIPLYTPSQEIPQVNFPKPSASDAGQAELAMAKTIGEISNVTVEMGNKLAEINSVRQYGNQSIAMQKQLMDLHDGIVHSPEFVTNPELAEKRFNDGAEQLQQQIQGSIGNPKVQMQLNQDFAHHVLSYSSQLRGDVYKQETINAAGDLMTNRMALMNMGISGNPLIAEQSKEKFKNIVLGMVATKGMRADAGVEAVQKFNEEMDSGRIKRLMVLGAPGSAANALAAGAGRDIPEEQRVHLFDMATKRDQAEEQRLRTQENQLREDKDRLDTQVAYDKLNTDFAGDKRAALDWISDPKSTVGYSPPVVERLKSWLQGDITHAQQQVDRQRVETNRTEMSRLVDLYSQNKLTLPDIDTSKLDGDKRLEFRTQWENKQQKLMGTEHPVVTELYRAVMEGAVKDDSDLVPYIGRGLGPEKIQPVRDLMKQVQDPLNTKYFSMAMDLYKNSIGSDKDLKSATTEFEADLAARVKAKGLTGEKVYEEAKQILTPKVTHWWLGRVVDWLRPDEKMIGDWFTETPFETDLKTRPWAQPAPPTSSSSFRSPIPSAPMTLNDQQREKASAAIEAWNQAHPDQKIDGTNGSALLQVWQLMNREGK